MTTATVAPRAPREVYQAALQRLGERRNGYATYSEAERRRAWLEGRTLPRMDPFAPRFRPPETAAEYFDDRLIEWGRLPGDPAAPVLVAVADAARESAAAVVQAVKAAKRLDRRVQWVIFSNLLLWKGGNEAAKTGADRIVSAALGEWSRLRLPETDPDGDE